ncbi:hypothetical protein ACO0QE_000795 [Hanseniaspora vineae]
MSNLTNVLIIVVLIFVCYVNVALIRTLNFSPQSRDKESSKIKQIDNVFVFLGSGGHTGEMLKLLDNYQNLLLNQSTNFYVCFSDDRSLINFQKKYAKPTNTLPSYKTKLHYIRLYKAREVGSGKTQSLVSIIATIINLLQKLTIPLISACLTSCKNRKSSKSVFLLNGPGTSVLISIYVRFFQFLHQLVKPLTSSGSGKNMKLIYVESLARVNKLSLSGALIYYAKLYDEFVVQWQELTTVYPDAKYYGILV